LGEHVTSIFRVEEEALQETSMKACDMQRFSATFLLGLLFGPED
jgi:hypothetical protein